MSCEQMMQFATGNRQSAIGGGGAGVAAAASDPYVFTEPPSIQTLQLHKATTSKYYPSGNGSNGGSGLTTPKTVSPGPAKSPHNHRHNVNESLKKKLGIAHIKVPSHSLPSSSPHFSSVSSPMIGGGARNGGAGASTTTLTTATKKGSSALATRRQSAPIDSLNNHPPPLQSTNNNEATTTTTNNNINSPKKVVRESTRGSRGKYTKREPKKSGGGQERCSSVSMLGGSMTNNSHHQNSMRDAELSKIPDEFWYGNDNAADISTLRHWYLPEISDSVASSEPPQDIPLQSSDKNSVRPLLIPLSRDERLELKRSELRRRTIQLKRAQQHKSVLPARRRFILVQSILSSREGQEKTGQFVTLLGSDDYSKEVRGCCMEGCSKDALVFSKHCSVHVQAKNDEKWLFAPCSAKLSDNLQCHRIPVAEVMGLIDEDVSLCEIHLRERERTEQVKKYGSLRGEKVAKMVMGSKKGNKIKGSSSNNSGRVTKATSLGGGGLKKAISSVTTTTATVPVYNNNNQNANLNQRLNSSTQKTPTMINVKNQLNQSQQPIQQHQQNQSQSAKQRQATTVTNVINSNRVYVNPPTPARRHVPVQMTRQSASPQKLQQQPPQQPPQNKKRPEMPTTTRFTKAPPTAVLPRQQVQQQQQQQQQKVHHPKVSGRGATVTMMMMQHEHDDFVDEDDSVDMEMEGDEEFEEVLEEVEVDSLLSQGMGRRKQVVAAVKRNGGGGGSVGYKMGGRGGRVNQQTDLLLVSENSSAYESSEDTGVGGLSESEMIEEIGFDSQFLEDPEFNNVLDDLLAVEQHGGFNLNSWIAATETDVVNV